ncbi:MAG TPA: monovalent cation/H(+) antiporter subunit G [Salinibacter sp.]|nr:monovalent cation/H(+) antiporter subunit G [Salinibacter sp.]
MIAHLFLLVGSLFVLVAALGVLRLPDLLMRMHAATKAGTLGAGLLLVGVAVSAPETSVMARALATFVFLLLTAPIAAHLIARAAYHTGEATLWDRTCVDELAEAMKDDSEPNSTSDRTNTPAQANRAF